MRIPYYGFFKWCHRLSAGALIVFAIHYGMLWGFIEKYAKNKVSAAQITLLDAMPLESLTEVRVVDL